MSRQQPVGLRLLLVADAFPPNRSSGAVQLGDLATELANGGHAVTVVIPDASARGVQSTIHEGGATLLRVEAPITKDIAYWRRTINERLMPYVLWYRLRFTAPRAARYDAIVWYSPSIFFGPLIQRLKRAYCCRAYLIIRDIFPEWALDMGLLTDGLVYRYLSKVADEQYRAADAIGVQTAGNLDHFRNRGVCRGIHLEVLENWLAAPRNAPSPFRIECSPLAGRKIFVYAGNMGVAQGIDVLLELAALLQSRTDLGFLFIGRGSEVSRLQSLKRERGLGNVHFENEIDPNALPDLLRQCSVGMLALDPRHRSHNIPGKFLTYLRSGLPVLASINPGNDLVGLIEDERVGTVDVSGTAHALVPRVEHLLRTMDLDPNYAGRCRALFTRRFSSHAAAAQLVATLRSLS